MRNKMRYVVDAQVLRAAQLCLLLLRIATHARRVRGQVSHDASASGIFIDTSSICGSLGLQGMCGDGIGLRLDDDAPHAVT